MGRFWRRWPILGVGVLCLAAAIAFAETSSSHDDQTVIVFVAAIGAVLIGFAIGKGPTNGNGHE